MNTTLAPEMNVPLKLFVSYAHEDEEYRASLEKYLVVLKHQGALETWTDREIVAGQPWEQAILQNLESAHLISLLVSVDFLNSNFIQTTELRRALDRQKAGEAMVVPVLVRDTPLWQQVKEISGLQVLPVVPGAKPDEVIPVKTWTDPDQAWGNVVTGLSRTIAELRKVLAARATAAPAATDEWGAVRAALGGAVAVAGKFHADVATFGALVDVHHHLHTVQRMGYNLAFPESRRTDSADANWAALESVNVQLAESTKALKKAAALPSLAAADLAWCAGLDSVVAQFDAGVAANDLAPIRPALDALAVVLKDQPLNLCIQIEDQAQRQPLRRAADALKTAGANDAAATLARRHEALTALVGEHMRWQQAMEAMRPGNPHFDGAPSKLELSWPALRRRLDGCCAGSEENWAVALRSEIEKFESALAAGVPEKAAQTFRRTLSQADTRFYDVGLQLKSLCDSLRALRP